MKNQHHYYASNIPGTKIKNAITGFTYNNCYVGSYSEKNFYRVIDSTGKYNENGNRTYDNKNPNKLFFESYAEFEKFYKINNENNFNSFSNE